MRVLRTIFVLQSEEVTGGRRELQNDKSSNLYSSPDVIRMMKSRRIRLKGHVEFVEEMRNA
jgi:hypothetical protein